MNLSRLFASLAFVCTMATSASAADIRPFAIVYAWTTGLNAPKDAHTFATFGMIDVSTGQKLEQLTISWLPASLSYTIFTPAQPAKLFSLGESFSFAAANDLSIYRYGPFELTPAAYNAALNQFNRLSQGIATNVVLYKAMDGNTRAAPTPAYYPPSAMNCIHAVSDAFGFIATGMDHGPDASEDVVNLMQATHAINYAADFNPGLIMQILENAPVAAPREP